MMISYYMLSHSSSQEQVFQIISKFFLFRFMEMSSDLHQTPLYFPHWLVLAIKSLRQSSLSFVLQSLEIFTQSRLYFKYFHIAQPQVYFLLLEWTFLVTKRVHMPSLEMLPYHYASILVNIWLQISAFMLNTIVSNFQARIPFEYCDICLCSNFSCKWILRWWIVCPDGRKDLDSTGNLKNDFDLFKE